MQSDTFNDLLVDIPSQASSIAALCVEQFIEGHIHNPSDFARNIKRIASRVSRDWRTNVNSEIDEAGDGRAKVRIIKSSKYQSRDLIHLPQQVRCKIWSLLDTHDILSLRQLCRTARTDIDHEVGLPVVLNTSSDSFTWIRTVTVRKCLITRLDNHCYLNFLSRPECMKELRITHHVFIPAEIADLILRKFPSLSYISLYTQELLEVSHDGTKLVQITPSVASEMLGVVSQKRMIKISLSFIQSLQMTQWILELSTTLKNTPCSKTIEFHVPRHQLHQQKDCILMLDSDKTETIKELKCNLENMNWRCYETSVRHNANTLTGLYLHNLSLSCGEFECSLVEECRFLRVLALSGLTSENEKRILKIVQLNRIPLKRLCIFDLKNVEIPEAEFAYMRTHMKKSSCIKLRSCKGGDEFFIGLDFGRKQSELLSTLDSIKYSRDTIFFSPSEYDFKMNTTGVSDCKYPFDITLDEMDDEFTDSLREDKDKHRSSVTLFQIPPQLITGLLLTAYLALC